MTLDEVLNVLVPAIIFIFLAVLIYSKAKKPIDNFFAVVKGWFQPSESGGGKEEQSTEYKISYREPAY